jgi:hypothetical protein
MKRSHCGAHNELLATVWLLKQGYDVFRNVSAHGPVDIVAMKDGGIALFDVKQVALTIDGKAGYVSLKPEQIALRVKIIKVLPDGSCQIDWNPKATMEHGHRLCVECEAQFRLLTRRQRFCTPKCRSVDWTRRKRAKLGIRAIS